MKNSISALIWHKNTAGKPSMSTTFAVISFLSTTFAYIAAIFEKIGPYQTRPFDSAACSAYLIPILTLYFGRRWTEAKADAQNSSSSSGGSTES